MAFREVRVFDSRPTGTSSDRRPAHPPRRRSPRRPLGHPGRPRHPGRVHPSAGRHPERSRRRHQLRHPHGHRRRPPLPRPGRQDPHPRFIDRTRARPSSPTAWSSTPPSAGGGPTSWPPSASPPCAGAGPAHGRRRPTRAADVLELTVVVGVSAEMPLPARPSGGKIRLVPGFRLCHRCLRGREMGGRKYEESVQAFSLTRPRMFDSCIPTMQSESDLRRG
jgi:hypothetical protein